MRDGWTETTLDELVISGVISLGRGNVISKKDMEADPGPYPVYSSAQNNDGRIGSYNKFMFDEELITWSVDGGGYVFYRPPHKFSVTNIGGYLRILDNTKFLYPFLAAVLQKLHGQHVFDWQNKAHPSVIRKLYNNIPLASLDEQKRIVDVVSSVDAYIDSLQQQADTARTARNAVLHELLSAGGEDWTETTLGLLVSLRTGKLDVNAGVEDGEFPFFTCSRDTYKIDVAAYSGKSVIVAGNGDLNVKYYEGEFNAYQRTYILQAIDESVLNPTFLFHFMDKYLETLRNDTQGSTIQYLKKAQFTEAPIALPSLVEQKRIVEIVTSMDDVIQSTEQAVTDAKKLRSGLLSDLLSGEHEIPASYDVFVGAA